MVPMPTPRQLSLVSRIIEEHIQTAEPVSSKAIAQSGYFDVRSATIRNEMADLEEMGYLEQLHTSGGRVPTAQAYRLYVNELVAREGVTVNHAYRRRIDEALADADLDDPEAVNKALARVVGGLSGALVMVNMSSRPDAYKFGLSNLMAFPEFHEFDRLAGLTEFFDQFDTMADRMFRRMFAPADGAPVKVLIGSENPDDRIKDETTICARYRLPGGHEGTLTLVGPMRMDYRKNIGLVMYAAQAANRIA
jgi:transcriptional regulator of heat shock response